MNNSQQQQTARKLNPHAEKASSTRLYQHMSYGRVPEMKGTGMVARP